MDVDAAAEAPPPRGDAVHAQGVEPDSLRSRSMLGAAWMVAREGGGIAVRLVGVLLLTRLLGPADFGVYAGALAVITVVAVLAQLNSEIYLIRRPHRPTDTEVGTIFSLLLLSSGLLVLVALVGCVVAARLGMPEAYIGPFRLMLLGLVLNVLWAPAQAKLERALNYRSLGSLELSGDVVLYAVAVPLAVAGFGPYAPAWGYVGWQAWLLVGSCVLARVRPQLAADRRTAREVLAFGVAYSPVTLLPKISVLAAPVVVGALAGPAGIGFVALATRLVQTVGFVGRTAYRIALVVLAQIKDDVPRMSRAFREGLGLQALGAGVPIAVLCVISPVLVPVAFGEQWRPALEILPWFALALFVYDLFSLHAHVITVTGRLHVLAVTYLSLFVVQLSLAIVLTPALGLTGFGLAFVLALVSLWPLHVAVRRVFPPRYDEALPWLVGLGPVMFVPAVAGPAALLLCVPLVVVLALPASRRQLRGTISQIMRSLKGRSAGSVATG